MQYPRNTDSLGNRRNYPNSHWITLLFLHSIHYTTVQNFVRANNFDISIKFYEHFENHLFKLHLQEYS